MSRPANLDQLANLVRNAAGETDSFSQIGHIAKIIGMTVESKGPMSSLGDLVAVKASAPNAPDRLAEVIGFRDERLLLMPFETIDGVRNGDRVELQSQGFTIPVGDSLLGRVIDGLGRPIDGKGPINENTRPVTRPAPDSMSRARIKQFFHTGIRAIDAAMPCGKGQRVGVFSGSGVGKSTVLGMIARNCCSDLNVIALIGERGKEVREFIEDALGEEGLARSVVVVTTSDKPPLQRVKGAEVAMAVAEHFRDRGKDVLFVMDSITRYAMAQREIGLSAGEPPATKGYPPSTFSMLPRLLERAGTSGQGSVTAFVTVLVEGDDMNDPVADTVRGILDGHVVLSRDLAAQGHYPAIDILPSVSRVVNDVASNEHRQLAKQLRKLISVYRRSEDMINIGAYKRGGNAEIDRAIDKHPAIEDFLVQDTLENEPWQSTFQRLRNIV